MDLKMETELQGELLHATYTGRATVDMSLRFLRQVFNIAAEKRIRKILIDALAVSGVFSTFDRYRWGTEVAAVAAHLVRLGINPRIAFVCVPPICNGFGVLVAQNRGAIVELFPSLEEAQHWLGRPRTAL